MCSHALAAAIAIAHKCLENWTATFKFESNKGHTSKPSKEIIFYKYHLQRDASPRGSHHIWVEYCNVYMTQQKKRMLEKSIIKNTDLLAFVFCFFDNLRFSELWKWPLPVSSRKNEHLDSEAEKSFPDGSDSVAPPHRAGLGDHSYFK